MLTPPLHPSPSGRGSSNAPGPESVRPSTTDVEHAAVVIAARDDEKTVEAAVHAVRTAALNLPPGLTVDVVVVADSCSDRTAELAHGAGAHVLVTTDANVGAARALGCAWALDRSDAEEVTWLASTDADCVVPPSWLVRQVEAAASGADLFLGAVAVPDTDGARHRRRLRGYRRHRGTDRGAGHAHGANLGVRASTYVLAGGYADLSEGAATDLVERALMAGAAPLWTRDAAVTPSSRQHSRVAADVATHRAA